jgi:hypothetical protein
MDIHTGRVRPGHASPVVLVLVVVLVLDSLDASNVQIVNVDRSRTKDEVGITRRSMRAGNRSASASHLLRPDRAIDSTKERPEAVSDG